MARYTLFVLVLAIFAPAFVQSPNLQLTSEIREQDAKFFKLLFEVCDPDAMSRMLTADFEMYHDRGGLVAKGAPDFLSNYAKDCASWGTPQAVRARRVLVPDTLSVYPVPRFGAIEDGFHDFYARVGNGPEKKVGRGRFTQLWRHEPDGWRLSRVFSYDHIDEAPPPPWGLR